MITTKTTEYLVTLETVETAEYEAPWERTVAVRFDGDVNWDNWLEHFNHLECEEYRIVSVQETNPDLIEF